MALLSVPTDFSTLGLALAAAAPGDTVRILSGYAVTETCLITADSLTIDGQTGFAGLTLALGPTVTTLTITGTTPFRVIDNGGSNIITSQAGNQRFVVSGGLDTVDMGNGGATDLDRLQVDWATTTGNVTNGVWSPGDLADNEAYGAFINSNGVDRVDFSNVEVFDIRTGSGNDNFSTARGNDTVSTGGGDDVVNVLIGTFRADLGSGTDHLQADIGTTSANVVIDLGAQNLATDIGGGNFLAGVEQLTLTTGSGNDSIHILNTTLADNLVLGLGNDAVTLAGGFDIVDMGNGGATDLDRLHVDWATTTGDVTNGVWSPGDLADNEAYGAFINSNGVDRVDFSNVEVFDIRTGSGNDNFSTARGSDTVASGTGSDTINGDSGNDRLGLTGDGTDSILGGTGTDNAVLDYAASAQNVTGTLAGVTAGTYGTLVMTDVERVEVMLGAGNDSFVGGSLNDSMSGNGGRDSLDGGAGGDTILGGAGNDQLSGAGGNDLLNGGFGGDRLSDGQGDDLLFGDDGNDTMTGSTGADTYDGGAGIDHLVLAGNRADWSFSGGAADFSGQPCP